MVYKTQVDKNHYIYGDYLHFDRWISYFHQLNNVFFISKKVKKPHKNIDILEIGVGDKIVSNTLKNYGYAVKTMDISAELQPDIVAALPDIPIKKRVDCILCCEVFEHIRYKDVEQSMRSMSKKTKFLIVSVPHKSLYLSLVLRISLLQPLKLLLQLPTRFIKHTFNGEHYWELGTKGCSVNRFMQSVSRSGFRCIQEYRLTEYPYHHFFILESKN